MRRAFALAAAVMAALAALPAQAGNIANCEVVIMETVEDGAGAIASFRDATDVIASIYDSERPTVAVIDGYPIRGLMCTRRNPVPDTEDFPLIGSGIPLVISTDFESSDAATVTLALNENREAVALMAVGLSDRQQDQLDAVLDSYEPIAPAITLDMLDKAESDDEVEAEDMADVEDTEADSAEADVDAASTELADDELDAADAETMTEE